MATERNTSAITPRWVVERKYCKDNQLFQVIEVYAEGENKELVKEENKHWSYKKELIKFK